jgi:hypothetical protein
VHLLHLLPKLSFQHIGVIQVGCGHSDTAIGAPSSVHAVLRPVTPLTIETRKSDFLYSSDHG